MSAGFRSATALWLGGASAPPPTAGFRSLLAFWMGGACANPAVVTPPSPPAPPSSGGGGRGGLGRLPRRFAVNPRARLDDDELLLILMAALHVID